MCPGSRQADGRFAHRTLLRREGGRLPSLRGRSCRSGARRQPRFARSPGDDRDYSRRHEPVSRAPAHRGADRRRRRDRRADLGGGPRAAVPRGGEPSLAGERRCGARELHRRGGGAHRDQHLRREPAQARARAPRRRLRADQLRGRPARPRGAGGCRPGRLRRGVDRAAGRARGLRRGRARPAVRGAGTGAGGAGGRPVHGGDVLRPRGARGRGPGGPRRLVAPDRRPPDVRRRRRDHGRGRGRGRRPPTGGARRGGDRTNHGAGPDGGVAIAQAMARRRDAARRATEHRSREPLGRTGGVPALDPGLLRGVRRAGGRRSARGSWAAVAGPRRRRSRPSARRSTRAARRAGRSRSTSPSSASRSAAREGETAARTRPPRGRVGRLGGARPSARAARSTALSRFRGRSKLRPRRLRRRQRQPHGPRADERADDLRGTPAGGRDRDDPARDAARHHRDGARGRPARRARRGRAERPGGHGRPAARRRLPRSRGVYEVDSIGLVAALSRSSTAARTSTARQSTRRPRSSSASPSIRLPTTSSSSSTGSAARSTRARASR